MSATVAGISSQGEVIDYHLEPVREFDKSVGSPQSPSTADSPNKVSKPPVASCGEAFLPTRDALIQDNSQLMAQSPRVQMLKKQLSERSRAGSGEESVPAFGEREFTAGPRAMNVGLNNLGNTCFMNSSLQCILHIEPLTSFFLNGSYAKELNEKSPTKGVVASSFAHLLSEISKASSGSRINPQQFQKAICIYAPHLLDEQQQDCQEFLRFLLNGMSDDLFRRPKCTPSDSTDNINHKRNLITETVTKRSLSFKGTFDSEVSSGAMMLMSASVPLSKAIALSSSDKGRSSTADTTYSIDNPIGRPRSAVAKLRSITAASQDSAIDCSNGAPVSETAAIEVFEAEVFRLNVGADYISLADTLSPINSPLLSPDDDHAKRLEDSLDACLGSQPPEHNDVGLDLLGLSMESLSVEGSLGSGVPTAPLTQSYADHDTFSVTKEEVIMKDRPQQNEINNEKDAFKLALTAENLREISAPSDSPGVHVNSISTGTVNISNSDVAMNESDDKYEKIAGKSAADSWNCYLSQNDSIITDLFSGQLQSTVECLVCHHKSFCFDPFLDLSVPIPMLTGNATGESTDPRSGAKSSKWRRRLNVATGRQQAGGEYPSTCTLEECIAKFTADEILDDVYTCEKCEKRQKCMRKMALYKCPEILVIHIKRFQYTSIVREKLFTDVQFPLVGLDMKPYLSLGVIDPHASAEKYDRGTIYDLSGVVHHSGGINGGHYVAHVADPDPDSSEKSSSGSAISRTAAAVSPNDGASWVCFNDAHVSSISPKHITGPSAYVLFYKLRK